MNSFFIKSFVAMVGFCAMAEKVLSSPTLGDSTEWNATITLQGTVHVGTSRYELVKYDPNSRQFTKRYTEVIDGQTQVREEFAPFNRVISKDTAANYVKNCKNFEGGVPETLPFNGTSLAACKLPVDDQDSTGFMWIAAVPDLLAQADVVSRSDGGHHVLILKSYNWK